jgi:transcriptional regulator with XRE-family HTH domain
VASFAILLRKHRIDRGLSQDALAEAAGVSTSAVGAYERGIHSAPHRTTIGLLADALRLAPDARDEFERAARRKPRVSIPDHALAAPHVAAVLGMNPGNFEATIETLAMHLRRHAVVVVLIRANDDGA